MSRPARALAEPPGTHLVAGALHPGDEPAQPLADPLTGEASRSWTPPGKKLEAQALAAACAAEAAAEALPVAARAAALEQLAEWIEADSAALAALAVRGIGCPVAQAPALHVASAAGVLRAFAALARTHRFEEERPAARGGRVTLLRRPFGPALGIVPWNVPLYLACAKLGAAVAAGTPILLKPSPENAEMMARFAALLARLPLPDAMVQLLLGDRECGARLVADPRIAKVSFTGSTPAGLAVAQACAARLARVTLELGGKSAAILLDDVEMERIAPELFLATLQNNGQVCGAQSRLLVPRSRAAELKAALAALFDALLLGDPADPSTAIGPLATPTQAARVRALSAAALAAGARPLNRRRTLPARGAFAEPLLLDAGADAEIAREEVFGPVVVVHSYADEAEAVRIANASPYGLSGSVWSADPARAVGVARQLRTGSVGIASRRILDFNAPFGGWRASGIGRELGPEGIDAFLETTAILRP